MKKEADIYPDDQQKIQFEFDDETKNNIQEEDICLYDDPIFFWDLFFNRIGDFVARQEIAYWP